MIIESYFKRKYIWYIVEKSDIIIGSLEHLHEIISIKYTVRNMNITSILGDKNAND